MRSKNLQLIMLAWLTMNAFRESELLSCPHQQTTLVTGKYLGQQICLTYHPKTMWQELKANFCETWYPKSMYGKVDGHDYLDLVKLHTSSSERNKVICPITSKAPAECPQQIRPAGMTSEQNCVLCELISCLHEQIDFCRDDGSCMYDHDTNKCTFSTKYFYESWFDEHNQCVAQCRCDLCRSTTWSEWYKCPITDRILRTRPFDNNPTMDCSKNASLCCTELLTQCNNGGTLNDIHTMCSCTADYQGLLCEKRKGNTVTSDKFALIVALSVTLLLLVFGGTAYLVYKKKEMREQLARRCHRLWALLFDPKQQPVTIQQSIRPNTDGLQKLLKDYEVAGNF